MGNVGNLYTFQANYMADPTVLKFFFIWGGVGGIVALFWTIYHGIKRKDWVPLLCWLGGLIASLNEGTLDILIHLTWPANQPGIAYWAYDNPVPLFMPFCYCFFVSMTGYFSYTQMKKGLTMKKFAYLWIGMCIVDFILELPGTALKAYIYQGPQPYTVLGFPAWNAWVNGTGFVLIGLLLYIFVPVLKGWKQLGILLIVPFAFIGAWGTLAFPVYNALNWTGPNQNSIFAQWLWVTFSLFLALVLARVMAGLCCADSPWSVKPLSLAEKEKEA